MNKEEKEQIKEDITIIECAIDNMVTNCLRYTRTYTELNLCVPNKKSVFNEIYKTMQNTNFAIGELLSLKYRIEGKLQEGEQQ